MMVLCPASFFSSLDSDDSQAEALMMALVILVQELRCAYGGVSCPFLPLKATQAL